MQYCNNFDRIFRRYCDNSRKSYGAKSNCLGYQIVHILFWSSIVLLSILIIYCPHFLVLLPLFRFGSIYLYILRSFIVFIIFCYPRFACLLATSWPKFQKMHFFTFCAFHLRKSSIESCKCRTIILKYFLDHVLLDSGLNLIDLNFLKIWYYKKN